MPTDRFVRRHRPLVLLGAIAAPVLLCALLSLASRPIENTSAALLLVLVVVGAASTGLRSAGLLAVLSGALSFDYFLTAPYHTLRILDRTDLETAFALLLVGVAVTELALWGRRQQARASEQSGYLGGVLDASADSDRDGGDPAAVIARIEHQLVTVLDLDTAHYHREPAGGHLPRLDPDGRLLRDDQVLDVDRTGLPTDSEISLPVRAAGRRWGEFRLTAASHIARPTRDQRRVAVLLANQAGAAARAEGIR